MDGTIATWSRDKGFGFIKDENGDNRYFHVIKAANPELVKRDATVIFEPITSNKDSFAYVVGVIPDSRYIYIAGERLRLISIKSLLVYGEEVPAGTRIDKENIVPSTDVLMSSIRSKSDVKSGEMRALKKLVTTTFQGTTLILSEDEVDINTTVGLLRA